ncbi:cytochrome P450 [Actinoplanes sp. TFC3]|uniref:cytochrome P450 n=1 Tax=Actinoplanes sp. TFC3 TaxID=1710355 RepID=UPI0008373121|nr:cytochrome P450 [Actinoplanes sp. TFC3]
MAQLDQTALAALKGYAWLPDLRREAGGGPVHLRVMGQPAVGICGTEATRFFYAANNVERHTALPSLVVSTLFGKGAVHTLDREAHRARKALFVPLLMGDGIDAAAKLVGEAFDQAADSWRGGGEITLMDESARAITRGVTRWTGIPLEDDEMDGLAADLLAMVDGFATVGPRHWRALRARHRRERWLASLIDQVRTKRSPAAPDSALAQVAFFEQDGGPLDPRTAAVELLNIIRPATAVAWFVAYTAHALDRWPQHAARLRSGDDAFTTAFVHEVRRFYPFAPFLGGRATHDMLFEGEEVPRGTLVLLDVYGQNHDPKLWPDPYAFSPERFLDRPIGEFELIPQGGGDPRTGHRCPGEQLTIAILGTLVQRLAQLDYYVPPQNMAVDLSRIPARVASGAKIVVT